MTLNPGIELRLSDLEKVSLPSEPYHQVLHFILRALEINILLIRGSTIDLWLIHTAGSSISQ